MSRFFVDPEAVSGETIHIGESDYNHIRNVLRMRIGDPLTVCDGTGWDYQCEIAEFGQNGCVLKIVERTESTVELPVAITLYQGLPKKDKMELIVQKAVELGAARIVPVLCERTIVKIDEGKKESRKSERLRLIAEGAAKQSGRGIVPEVSSPMTFKNAIADAVETCEIILVPYENALGMKYSDQVLSEAVSKKSIGIFIGPEGGFARQEIALAEEKGAKIISLGHRILRTETAGLAVLSNLMFRVETAYESTDETESADR